MGLAHEDDATELAVVALLLERAAAGQVLATAFDGGRPAAFGRAVVRGDLAGIFHVVTDAAHRRRGLGRRTVAALMAAAAARGARRAYLQVTVANAEARPLYAWLGFREVYVYDYWAA
nr:GNAT family N-acetyltransferase [Alsobacter ponti]